MVLFIIHQINPRLTKSAFTSLILFSGYGAGIMYYLKNNIKQLLLNKLEYVLIYVSSMLVVGFIAIKLCLSRKDSKRSLRVGIKWLIRLAGITLLYNSTSSPLASVCILLICSLLYFFYSLVKLVTKGNKNKVD